MVRQRGDCLCSFLMKPYLSIHDILLTLLGMGIFLHTHTHTQFDACPCAGLTQAKIIARPMIIKVQQTTFYQLITSIFIDILHSLKSINLQVENYLGNQIVTMPVYYYENYMKTLVYGQQFTTPVSKLANLHDNYCLTMCLLQPCFVYATSMVCKLLL